MATSSSSEDKTPEIKCMNGVVPISKLTANYPLIPRSELEVCEQLGAGTYGSVFKAIWRIKSADEPMVVALKKVFMLEREVDILSQIRHRNIIQFFGVSQANPDFYIVTEYAENGSLFEYLHNAKVELSFEKILKMAKQVASGVAYLHYEAPTTIIHRDLKSKNVVIGKKMVCKLCDFGTSKDLTHSHTAPTWGGTAAWMSPEIINQSEGITTATDVWSFGILLWEILSREIPYKGLTDFKIYSITSQEGCQLLLPDTCPTHLSDLLKKCWYKNPKKRIEMREVLASLDAININEKVHNECMLFVTQKGDWHQKIEEQLIKINEMELDYERRKEELKKWEQILRRRESSHRNFLHIIDIMNTTDVAEWDADCVCEWVQYMAAGKDISESVIDKVIGRVLQHEIRGSRLLQVTERDLENLGIEPPSIRQYIVEKVGELNLLRPTKSLSSSPKNSPHSASPQDDFLNFPPLQASADLEARNKQNKSPLTHPIVLVVGMYSRMFVYNNVKKCRFKIFLDSDWDITPTMREIPSENSDSATVIKDVFMSITSTADNVVLLESVRCVCPPFGYLEWGEVNMDESPKISVTLAVTYTDQIIQPRNTRINVEVIDFSQSSRVISTKVVPLKIRSMPTNTSLSRINSSMLSSQSPTDRGNLQGVWRARRSSIDNMLPSPRSASGVVNEIIPISLMSHDIEELHRRYQQRFVQRASLSNGTTMRKTSSPKSPLADDANSRNGPFSRASLQNRSISAINPTKQAPIRRSGPTLTVVVPAKLGGLKPPGRKLSSRKISDQVLLKQQHLSQMQRKGSGGKLKQNSRTKSAETTAQNDEGLNVEENCMENENQQHPIFYVSDDPSTSNSLAENDVSEKELFSQKVNQNTNLPEVWTSRKSSNLENESPDVQLNGRSILMENRASQCNGEQCECRRSRRTILPEATIDDDSDLNEKYADMYLDELEDRKYRPKANGGKKYKKSGSKPKLCVDQTSGDAIEPTDKQETNQPNAKCLKQNSISRQVYGGYNKWRWK